MSNRKFHFTTNSIRSRCSPPAVDAVNGKGNPVTQLPYWDTQLKGFGLIASRTTKSFIIRRWVEVGGKKKNNQQTLGQVDGDWNENVPVAWRKATKCTLAAAREAGLLFYAQWGQDPMPKDSPKLVPTLGEAIKLHAENKRVKGSDEENIESVSATLRLHLADWLDLPLDRITKTMCNERHAAITANGKPGAANSVFDKLRAVWNVADKKLDDIPANAARSITRNKSSKTVKPLPWRKLPKWAEQTNNIKNPIRRDLWWFILFTGLRATDACTVRWEHLNLTDKPIYRDFGMGEVEIEPGCMHRPKPKGGEDKAFTVPLCTYVLDILRRRKAENSKDFGNDRGWVWPSKGKDGHVYPKGLKESEYWKDETGKLRKRSVSVHPHKLRHTFKTAGYEAGVPKFDLDILTNHTKPASNDVGERYITPSPEYLRKQLDTTVEFLLAKMVESGAVIARVA